MPETKFHAENWMSYYDTRIDEDYLNACIDDYYEGYPDAKIEVSGDKITTYVNSGLALELILLFEDVNTGEEFEEEVYTVADFNYTVDYKIDDLDEDDIEEIQKELDKTISAGQSSFKAPVHITVIETRDVEITYLEQHNLDDEFVERIGGESKIISALQKAVEKEFLTYKDERHRGDFIQPTEDKKVKFICTIPAE